MRTLYRWLIGDWWRVKALGVDTYINYNTHRRIRMLDYSGDYTQIKEWTRELNHPRKEDNNVSTEV